MDMPGFRNAPSLMYASLTPAFFLTRTRPAASSATGAPHRSPCRRSSRSSPPFEMANADAAEVVTRLQASPATLALFTAAFGAAALSDPDTALADMGAAIAAYETEDPEFHPFSSKFDYWLAGTAHVDRRRAAGLALFNNPGKGNCTACHPSSRQGYSDAPAVHRLHLRQHRRAAQLGHPGQPAATR